VTQSGGFIECSSELGRGTTFRVYLPRFEAQPESPPAVQSRPSGTCGVETVLRAEDEESVRRLVREGLRSLGYWVLEARDGREALSMAARHTGPVHLLLTDVVMPEMSGPVLAHQLSLARPQTRVLFMSGYNDDATIRHGMAPGAGLILQKPFSLQTLGARVRAVLDGCDADIPTRS
jgi:two-component system, cell cycle sensor histidine kinase and response regulator CckA